MVGGVTATDLDTKTTSTRDRTLIIPVVIIVVFVILSLLLRSLLAPLLLMGTVVLSFAATLGISSLVFDHVFGFPGADPVVPLFAFVFLVALGIDYNIFLMTRVREEALKIGTRAGAAAGTHGDRRGDHICRSCSGSNLLGVGGDPSVVPRPDRVHRGVRCPARRSDRPILAGPGLDQRHRSEDLVAEQARVDAPNQSRISQHLPSLRAVSTRLGSMQSWSDTALPSVPGQGPPLRLYATQPTVRFAPVTPGEIGDDVRLRHHPVRRHPHSATRPRTSRSTS